jgi:hypothetical protein
MADVYRDKWVKGLTDAQRTFRALPEDIRGAMNTATENAAVRVLAGARQRVAPHRRYGFLERYLGLSMNEKTGTAKVGLPAKIRLVIAKGARPGAAFGTGRSVKAGKTRFTVMGPASSGGTIIVRPSKYAHLVEFGHKRGRGHGSSSPSPFMVPSAEAERGSYVAGCKSEMEKLTRDLERKAPTPSSLGTVGIRYL